MMSTLAVGAALLAIGHVLPDDLVERAVQVTVVPDRLEIRYQIGFNENTLQEQLQQLEPDRPVPADPDEALDRYRAAVLPHLAERLQVTIDGLKRDVRPVEARRIFLHHAQLEAVLHVPLDAAELPADLELHDANFPDTPGNHRLAAKGRAGLVVTDSNVPPILARADRLDTETLTAQELAARRDIRARLERAGDVASEGRDDISTKDPSPAEPAESAGANEVPNGVPMSRDERPPEDTSGQIAYRVADEGVLDRSAGEEHGEAAEAAPSVSGQTVLWIVGLAGLLLAAAVLLARRKR